MVKKTHYTTEELRKIVRLEDIGSDIWHPDETEVTFDAVYEMSLDDLRDAMKAIIDKNLPCRDVMIWLDCLNGSLYDGIGPKDCLDEDEGYHFIKNVPRYEFPDGESGVIYFLWNYLFEAMSSELYDMDEDKPAGQIDTVKDGFEYIVCFMKNQKTPRDEWIYPVFMMENFIDCFDDDNVLSKATEAEKKRFVRWVDSLADKENQRALHARCYGKYTGNAVYKQDFSAARDDAEKLFELTQNPQYANTLGYICYYGRCTGGKPEYDKALTYFTFGAANGLYESIYKLSDMYKNGYGVLKSPKTAYRLIRMLYDDISAEYEAGLSESDFADIALRLGSMELYGIGTDENPNEAINILLSAEYAIKKRMAEHDFYGDNVVAAGIRQCLAEAKEMYPPRKNTGKMEDLYFWTIERLMRDDYKIGWRARQLKCGDWSVTFYRIPKRRENEPRKSFFIIPSIYYCAFTDTIKGRVRPIGGKMPAFGMADDFDIIYQDGGEKTTFYFGDEVVFTVEGAIFDWRFPKPKKKSGKTVRLIGITFSPGGRQYDYLCDDDDIVVGDTVIVNGYNGQTEVTVQNISAVAVEDLILPLEKFKKARKKR